MLPLRYPSTRRDISECPEILRRDIPKHCQLFILKKGSSTLHFLFRDYNTDGTSHSNESAMFNEDEGWSVVENNSMPIIKKDTLRECVPFRKIREVYSPDTLIVSKCRCDKGIANATHVIRSICPDPFLMCPTYWTTVSADIMAINNITKPPDIDFRTNRMMADSQLSVTGRMAEIDNGNIYATACRKIAEKLGLVAKMSKLKYISTNNVYEQKDGEKDGEKRRGHKTTWTTFVVKAKSLKPYKGPVETKCPGLTNNTLKCQVLIVGSKNEIEMLGLTITQRPASQLLEHDVIRSFVIVPYCSVTMEQKSEFENVGMGKPLDKKRSRDEQ